MLNEIQIVSISLKGREKSLSNTEPTYTHTKACFPEIPIQYTKLWKSDFLCLPDQGLQTPAIHH